MRDGILAKLQGSLIPVSLLVFWQLGSASGGLNPYLFPSPISILQTMAELVQSGELLRHVVASLYRLSVGLSITLGFALPLGLILGLSRSVQRFLNPTLAFLQQIPAIAWIPIFILWLGIGESSKIALMVYASFFPVFINTLFGIQSVDPKLAEVAEAFRLTFPARIIRVYLPSAAPYIAIGIRLGLSNGWRALVAAEILASSRGLGYLLMEGRNMAQPELLFIAILIIGVLGALLDSAIRRIEKWALPWANS